MAHRTTTGAVASSHNAGVQLHAFRRRVWVIKMAEVVAAAVFAVMTAFLCVFALDRLWDMPRWLRLGVWAGAMCGCAIVPLYLDASGSGDAAA